MNYSDAIDFDSQFYSTTTNQNNINFLDNSFEYPIKDEYFETEINKSTFVPITPNSEIFNLGNDINILQNPINLVPKNLLFIHEPHKEIKQKSLLGRKKANSCEIGKHTKFDQDNMIRKFKPYFKDCLKDLINSKIQKYIKFPLNLFNINKYKKIEILNINQEQVKDISVKMNIEFLQKKVKDFFSVNISGNYSRYPKNFNELLIKELYKIENGEKITCILDKTIEECLKFFRMDEDVINNPDYSCLKGLEQKFLDFKNELLNEYKENYTNKMIYLIKNFELIYKNKRRRKSRIKKNEFDDI